MIRHENPSNQWNTFFKHKPASEIDDSNVASSLKKKKTKKQLANHLTKSISPSNHANINPSIESFSSSTELIFKKPKKLNQTKRKLKKCKTEIEKW